MAPRKVSQHLSNALRYFAWRMADDPEAYSVEEGQMIDRALRTCPNITDIDRVWVRWRYVADQYGWVTVNELIFKNGRYSYPEPKEEEP